MDTSLYHGLCIHFWHQSINSVEITFRRVTEKKNTTYIVKRRAFQPNIFSDTNILFFDVHNVSLALRNTMVFVRDGIKFDMYSLHGIWILLLIRSNNWSKILVLWKHELLSNHKTTLRILKYRKSDKIS